MKPVAHPLAPNRSHANLDGSVAALLAVSVAAGGVLVWWSSAAIPHHGVSLAPAAVVGFLGMWLAMVVAMMLPTAMPMVIATRRVGAPTGRGRSLVLALVTGYLSIWLAGGAVALLVDVGIRDLLAALSPDAHPMPGMAMPAPQAEHAVASLIILAAGTFQLTPLAGRCVRACRSPFGFFARGWHGGAGVHGQALRIGVRYGLSCLGCCAGAMAVLLLVGMEQLWWMAGAGLLMALQKRTSAGIWIARVVGTLLAVLGFILVVKVTLM